MLGPKTSAAMLILLGLLTAWSGAHVPAQEASVNVAELKDQLKNGLKARRPQDFAFIDRVCTMVADGQLPVELVQSTFQWARKNAKDENYPYPWFEYALRARAKKLGIVI